MLQIPITKQRNNCKFHEHMNIKCSSALHQRLKGDSYQDKQFLYSVSLITQNPSNKK